MKRKEENKGQERGSQTLNPFCKGGPTSLPIPLLLPLTDFRSWNSPKLPHTSWPLHDPFPLPSTSFLPLGLVHSNHFLALNSSDIAIGHLL